MTAAGTPDAPDRPGVYCFLAPDGELLYVGKATSLRARLAQHARDGRRRAAGDRMSALYRESAEVRWEVHDSEDAAAAREADLIVALQPRFNASIRGEGRWNYVVVEPSPKVDGATRFSVCNVARGRAYGCFPHLGTGVSSRRAIACSDGYGALLRVLWYTSARPGDRMPSRLARAVPSESDVVVAADPASLHAFLRGTSDRLLRELPPLAEPYLAPALARDRDAAAAFFREGPRALRALRLHHGEKRASLPRERIEALIAHEWCDAIGDFRLPAPTTERDAHLGRRSHPWLSNPATTRPQR